VRLQPVAHGHQLVHPGDDAALPSPILWGDDATVRGRLGGGTSNLRLTPRVIALEFPLALADVVEFWRIYYGSTNRAFEALAADPARQADLRADLERFWSEHNLAASGSTRVDSEYLEVIGTRSWSPS
jgi:hypothetical protein